MKKIPFAHKMFISTLPVSDLFSIYGETNQFFSKNELKNKLNELSFSIDKLIIEVNKVIEQDFEYYTRSIMVENCRSLKFFLCSDETDNGKIQTILFELQKNGSVSLYDFDVFRKASFRIQQQIVFDCFVFDNGYDQKNKNSELFTLLTQKIALLFQILGNSKLSWALYKFFTRKYIDLDFLNTNIIKSYTNATYNSKFYIDNIMQKYSRTSINIQNFYFPVHYKDCKLRFYLMYSSSWIVGGSQFATDLSFHSLLMEKIDFKDLNQVFIAGNYLNSLLIGNVKDIDFFFRTKQSAKDFILKILFKCNINNIEIKENQDGYFLELDDNIEVNSDLGRIVINKYYIKINEYYQYIFKFIGNEQVIVDQFDFHHTKTIIDPHNKIIKMSYLTHFTINQHMIVVCNNYDTSVKTLLRYNNLIRRYGLTGDVEVNEISTIRLMMQVYKKNNIDYREFFKEFSEYPIYNMSIKPDFLKIDNYNDFHKKYIGYLVRKKMTYVNLDHCIETLVGIF